VKKLKCGEMMVLNCSEVKMNKGNADVIFGKNQKSFGDKSGE
jgi:hypothetical protein